MTSPVKKKLILINRDLQFRFAGAGLIASLVASLIMAVLILYPLFSFKILTSIYFLPWPVMVGVVFAILINMIVQLIFGIILTHRIAGPMYGMIRTIRQIGAGRWSAQVKLRDQDELQMIGRHLNEMSEQLIKAGNDDVRRIEQVSSKLALLNIDQSVKEPIIAELNDVASKIKQRISSSGNRSENND